MKDAVITVRLPKATRRRVERLARAERRSLSQQVEHLIEAAMAGRAGLANPGGERARPLAGALAGGRVPTLLELRAARAALSRALEGPGRGRAAR
jgi:hypothetical protein